jgi:hypothetical protein
MKNIVPSYNPISGNLEITIEMNLLKKYFPNFEGLISMDEELSQKGCTATQTSSTTALVSLPVDKSMTTPPDENGMGRINADESGVVSLFKVLNSFVNSAIKKELRITEFIPLHGYPVEDLQTDIEAAVKAKRNLCIIGEYEEYLERQRSGNFSYHQYMIDYGTEEYVDAAILIKDGKLDELRKLYEPKLVYTEWC